MRLIVAIMLICNVIWADITRRSDDGARQNRAQNYQSYDDNAPKSRSKRNSKENLEQKKKKRSSRYMLSDDDYNRQNSRTRTQNATKSESVEKSGWFWGVEAGVHRVVLQYKIMGLSLETASAVGVESGLMVGYKHMFNDYFGLRAYGQFIYGAHFNFNIGYNTQIELNANADVLVNFLETDDFILGAYAGIGVGLLSFLNPSISGMFSYEDVISDFNLPVNVGLRAVLSNNYSIELGARIPALPVEIVNQGMEAIEFNKQFSIYLRFTLPF